MRLHANAKLSVKGRELLIDRVEVAGWSLTQAAEAAGVSDRTARKWLDRYCREGADGLLDRCSAPATVANRTAERRVEAIAALRRLRMTAGEIAEVLCMAHSTVSGILTKRAVLSDEVCVVCGERPRREPVAPADRDRADAPRDLTKGGRASPNRAVGARR